MLVVLVVSRGCCHILNTDNRNVVSVDTDSRNVVGVGHDINDRVLPLDNFDSPKHGTSAGLNMGLKVGHVSKVYSTLGAHKTPFVLDVAGF